MAVTLFESVPSLGKPVRLSGADDATPAQAIPLFHKTSIHQIKGMAVNAMGLTGVLCRWAYATKYVCTLGYCLKMAPIDTWAIAAKMVRLHSFWDGTIAKFIGNPGYPHRLSIERYMAVAIGVKVGRPNPAGAEFGAVSGDRAVLINLGPEAVNGGIIEEHREPPTLGVMHRAVTAAPVPFIVPQRVWL